MADDNYERRTEDSQGRQIHPVLRGKVGLSASGLKTADGQIKASAGAVYMCTISKEGTIGLADSIGDSAIYIWGATIPADGYAHYIFDPPWEFDTGIWFDVTNGTPDVYIGYI